MVDRFGTRWIAVAGGAIYAAGLVVTAFATSTLLLTLGAGVMIGLALSCSTSGVAAKVAARVVRPERRSLAFGLVSAAGSIGNLFAAPLAQEILQAQGVQMGIRTAKRLAGEEGDRQC